MRTLSIAASTVSRAISKSANAKPACYFCCHRCLHAIGRALALLCVLPILLATGCAGTRPYYSDSFFAKSTIDESDRSEMVVYLDWVIRIQRAKQITMITPQNGEQRIYPRDDSSPPSIDWLPLPVLFAARYILNPKFKGEEFDLLVHTEADGYTPVTALHELDGTIRIEMGPPLKTLLPPSELQPTREGIVKRFGVGAVRDGASSWRPLELYSLEQALTLLSRQELEITRNLSFVRHQGATTESTGPSSNKNVWGRYSGNLRGAQGREIQLFDSSPGHDSSAFIGEPEHPFPIVTMCLLHEIGHAIADYARIRMKQRRQQWTAVADGLVRDWKSWRATNQLTAERAVQLEQRAASLKATEAELLQRSAAIRQQYREELGPVLAAYEQVRNSEKGPTLYGRTRIEESFAESFALHKADPAALRRINPALAYWFASNGHIKALIDALDEDIAPLNQPSVQQQYAQ